MDMGDEETLLSVSNNDSDDRGVGVQVSQTQHTLLHLLRLRMGEKLDTHTGNVCSLDENSIKSGEFSEDLYQRSHQDTRWAKVDMSVMHAFFRNVPTIYTCMGRCIRNQEQHDSSKAAFKEAEKPRNPMFWLPMLAFSQFVT